MKRLLSLLLIAITFTVTAADKSTAVFTLDHQMSNACKLKINTNLRYEKGVQKINVSLPDNTITIIYNPEKTDEEKLIEAFKKIGFNAMLLDPNTEPVNPSNTNSNQ